MEREVDALGDRGERGTVIGDGAGRATGDPGVRLEKVPGVMKTLRLRFALPGDALGDVGVGDPDTLVSSERKRCDKDLTCVLLVDIASSCSFVSAS